MESRKQPVPCQEGLRRGETEAVVQPREPSCQAIVREMAPVSSPGWGLGYAGVAPRSGQGAWFIEDSQVYRAPSTRGTRLCAVNGTRNQRGQLGLFPPSRRGDPQEFFYGTDLNLHISASLCPPSPHPWVELTLPGQTALTTRMSSHSLYTQPC